MKRIVLTGFGLVTPGTSYSEKLWDNLLNKECLFEVVELSNGVKLTVGKNPDFNISEYDIEKKKLRYMDKQVLYSLVAAFESVKLSNLEKNIRDEETAKRIGVVMGSMFAQMEFGLKQVKKVVSENSIKISPYTGLAFYYGTNVGEISVTLKTRGENCAVMSGTNIGIDAVNIAANMLKRDINDVVLAGGGENIVFDLFFKALEEKNKLSRSSYRPFDIRRDGSYISNGAGILTLETEEHAVKREAEIFGEIVSSHSVNASSCMFKLNEKITDSICKVITRCLEDANMTCDEIDLILPTGDASEDGDYYEMLALKRIFKVRKNIIYTPRPVVGYCPSFNSIVDIFVGAMAIKHGLIPGHPEKYDSGDVEFNNMLVGTETIKREVKNVLVIHRSWIDGKVSALVLRKYMP